MTVEYCYVPGFHTNECYVLDPSSGTIIANPTIVNDSTWATLTLDGTKAFCSALVSTGSAVSVIDTASNTVVATVALPSGIGIGSTMVANTDTLYVSAQNTSTFASVVCVMDIATLTFGTTIPYGYDTTGPGLMAISNDGAWVYIVAGATGNRVYGIDTSTNAVTTCTTDPNTNPNSVAISPNSSIVYVGANSSTGTYYVYKFAVGATAPASSVTVTSSYPDFVYVSQDGLWVYAVLVSGDLMVISAGPFTLSHTDTGLGAIMCATPTPLDTTYVVGLAHVYQYDNTGTNVATFATPTNRCIFGAVSPDGTNLFVVDSTNDTVYQYAVPANTLSYSYNTPTQPQMLTTANPSIAPTTQTAGILFIPRKGMSSDYTSADLYADWLAIELWANNSFTPPVTDLYIPNKTSTAQQDILAAFLHVQDWANNTVVAAFAAASTKVNTLFIPTKTSADPNSLTTAFLSIQDWANAL